MEYNLGFIGGGNMSTIIFKGILRNDTHPASQTWVSGPHPENLEHWKKMGANVTCSNGEVFEKCDIVFLGVKPAMLHEALKDVGDSLSRRFVDNPDLLVISMLAGVNLDSLQKAFSALNLQKDVKNFIKIVRIMPNVPMAVGSGISLYSYNHLGGKQKSEMVRLLQCCGSCEEIPEYLMDSLGSLTGCGPAYIFVIIEALADGAVKQGVPRAMALRNAAQMVMGSAALVLESNKHPAQLKDEVCSPGGSTICGVSVLEEGRLRSTLINALEASTNRTKKLDPNAANSK
ncbi:uncharacterized protein LOC114357676 [Ostrinia furnacalis]|uniref:uncharacterized protein LOC114357676 n=1 Tax=Ostrinia furnacalis TaxID=93504 RepID=UPI00103DEE05|nr:uncharacterized protein LOC114357676 [Ostrinia furnacalis]